MKLLILNGVYTRPSGRNLSYRGTFRINPTYCDDLPSDHELNKLFMWYLEEGGESGVVHDLPKAIRIAELCNAQAPQHQFEVLEVLDGNDAPRGDQALIGFDLSEGYCNSLLQCGLKQFTGALKLPSAIREFSELLSRHYAPQLNVSGLFQTLEVASSCLQSMIALQSLSPSIYEGGDLSRFKVVGVYALPRNTQI